MDRKDDLQVKKQVLPATCLNQNRDMTNKHVGTNPHVRPHPKNTPKQSHILVIKGGMKTLALRRDFDCCLLGFRVLGF